MRNWFDVLAASSELPADAAYELDHQGFVVLPGPVPCERIERLTDAYDAAVSSAKEVDVKIGSTSTRVNDFVNRGEEFDALYVFPPLLDACCRVIGQPFKLSSLHARTLRPHSRSGELHVDVRRGSPDWPLLSFILMVDGFQPENGATRFVPRSHQLRRSLQGAFIPRGGQAGTDFSARMRPETRARLSPLARCVLAI